MTGRRRVVVTGLGAVSPVGNDVASSWEALLAGRSGIGPITRFDASGLGCRIAGEVKNFDLAAYMSPKEARRMDTFIHYGIAASVQAIKDSGIEVTDANRERIGCVIGSGIGGLPMIEDNHTELLNRGPRRVSPFLIPGSIINMIAGNLSIQYGLKGPNLAIVTACTTGLHSIGEAGRLIEYGDADVMIAGGSESTICPLGIGGFDTMRALSTRNDDPTTASRPWDKDRDGFVMGEGAGIMVLEDYEHATKRGARIYCELVGFGMSADAYHMTAPDMDGARRCMVAALRSAGVNADQVNYLNAHGTSTPLGDVNETNAIKAALGDAARRIVVNSTKSMTGHLLGGAGGVESVVTALAVHHQVSPPDDQHLQPGPRLRSRLLREHRAGDAHRRRAEELVRFRRHERHAGFQAHLSARRLDDPVAVPTGAGSPVGCEGARMVNRSGPVRRGHSGRFDRSGSGAGCAAGRGLADCWPVARPRANRSRSALTIPAALLCAGWLVPGTPLRQRLQCVFAAPWLITLKSGTMWVRIWPDSVPGNLFRRFWVHVRWSPGRQPADRTGATAPVPPG